MTQYVSTHALQRAASQLSTGGVLELDAKRTAAGYDALQELDHQFQVPISGIARSGIGWATFVLSFDVSFVFAPEQRDSPLAVPHFTYGVVVSGKPILPDDGGDPVQSATADVAAAKETLRAAVLAHDDIAITTAQTELATAYRALDGANAAWGADQGNPASLVGVFVQVTEWARDHASDAVIGAILGIGVTSLGADVEFDGYVHLTFQGFGAPLEVMPANVDAGTS